MKIIELDLVEKKSKELLNNLFINSFEELNKQHENFLTALTNNVSEEITGISLLNDSEQISNFCHSKNDKKINLLENYHEYLNDLSYEFIINNFYEEITSLTADFPLTLLLDQDEYNFDSKKVAGTILKLLVALKFRVFKTSRYLAGLFKGKEYKRSYAWKRKIPLIEIINYYYSNKLPESFINHIKTIIKKLGNDLTGINEELIKHNSLLIQSCFKNEYKQEILLSSSERVINFLESLKNDFRMLLGKLAKLPETEIQNVHTQILYDLKVIGTVVLPFHKYSSEKNNKLNLHIRNKYSLIDERKSLYYKSIFNKFEFTFNLNAFQYHIIINSFNVLSKFKTDLNSRMEKVLHAFDAEIDNAIADLKKCRDTNKNLANFLTEKKNILHEKMDNGLIIEFVDILKDVNYGNVLTHYLKSIEDDLNIFSKDYLFVKPGDLKYGLAEKEFNRFTPKFIIKSLFLLTYFSFIKKQIGESTELYKSFNTNIINLGHVTAYNLNSALTLLEKEEIENCFDTAEDGLVRVKNRQYDFYNTLITSLENSIAELRIFTQTLLDKTSELNNAEKIINLKILAAKEKTISDLKNTFNNFLGKFKKLVLKLSSDASVFSKSALKRYSKLKTKVGLSDLENEISESISEYLSDTASSLEKIPPVYKNLFANNQINDELIFVGRTEELNKFDNAFNKWNEGKLSSLVIVGEKGSGTSSLFNIASKKFTGNIKLYRREFSKTIASERDFFEEISKLLKITDVTSIEEIISKINYSEDRFVVLIENLEDFYLKTINGFIPIYLLINIMSATHNKVFWIATCAKYSWNYLVKVVNIQDYFVFKIELRELSGYEIENIINIRHNISGYNLEFLPTAQDLTKAFKKLSEKEKVEFLKEKYFETVTKLTEGNIALSLFLWLRSIEKIDDDTVYVSTSINIDFSFLNNLTDAKIFSIAALIIHDGLNLEEHSEIFNLSKSKSKLIFDSLIEDGIIFKRNGKYKINFQLYRPLVNLLKNRNIFH